MSKLIDDKELMSRVLSKLDKIDDRLNGIDKTLVKQEENLKDHMRRSDLLEQSQGELKEYVKPILKVYTVAWGICKIVAAVALVVGLLVGIQKLLGL